MAPRASLARFVLDKIRSTIAEPVPFAFRIKSVLDPFTTEVALMGFILVH